MRRHTMTRSFIWSVTFAGAWLGSAPAWAQLDAPPEPPGATKKGTIERVTRVPTSEPSQKPTEPMPAAVSTDRYETVVHARVPSPQWTQDRSFTSTRFWLLDPGSYEVQTWFRTRIPHEVGGMRGPAEFLAQQE